MRLRLDSHIHCDENFKGRPGFHGVEEETLGLYIAEHRRRGLVHAVCVSEHHKHDPKLQQRIHDQVRRDLEEDELVCHLLQGAETNMTFAEFNGIPYGMHVGIYYNQKPGKPIHVPKHQLPIKEAVHQVHDNGGIVVLAHPYAPFHWSPAFQHLINHVRAQFILEDKNGNPLVDAVEVGNAEWIFNRKAKIRTKHAEANSELIDDLLNMLKVKGMHKPAIIGSSDTHKIWDAHKTPLFSTEECKIGHLATEWDVGNTDPNDREKVFDAFFEAVRNRRTQVVVSPKFRNAAHILMPRLAELQGNYPRRSILQEIETISQAANRPPSTQESQENNYPVVALAV